MLRGLRAGVLRASGSSLGRLLRRPIRSLVRLHIRGGAERIELVAVLGPKGVGRASVSRMWSELELGELFVGGVVVHPLARGIGVGSRLVRAAVSEAAARFADRAIYANTAGDNEASIRMFEGAGFTPVERSDWNRSIERFLADQGGAQQRQIVFRRSI